MHGVRVVCRVVSAPRKRRKMRSTTSTQSLLVCEGEIAEVESRVARLLVA